MFEYLNRFKVFFFKYLGRKSEVLDSICIYVYLCIMNEIKNFEKNVKGIKFYFRIFKS